METQNYMSPSNEPTKKDGENDNAFWRTPEALGYEKITQDLLLSDIPAYQAVYQLLDPKGKVVIDYGCFQGNSTARIALLGARTVIGVDINPAFIEQAQHKHTLPNLVFKLIVNNSPILVPDEITQVDAVAMTFVHPVISKAEILQMALLQVGEILRTGGRLIMLGLHQNSFTPQFGFISYEHRMPSSGVYRDGEPFPNKLVQQDGTIFEFDDYCWTDQTLRQFLISAGFKKIEFISLYRDLEGNTGQALRTSIIEVEKRSGKKYCDEFIAPLHQIIVAEK